MGTMCEVKYREFTSEAGVTSGLEKLPETVGKLNLSLTYSSDAIRVVGIKKCEAKITTSGVERG